MAIEPTADPLDLFRAWFADAERREPAEANAVALATVDRAQRPSLRMVLLKGADERGFVFYTNFESRKGQDLLATGQAALLFHWKSLQRQVRIEGPAAPVDPVEADAYFATRDRGSQIGAWASLQSQPMAGKMDLMTRVARFAAEYGLSRVKRPPHWSGFRIRPDRIEFWQEGRFRLHDRLLYERSGDGWTTKLLYP